MNRHEPQLSGCADVSALEKELVDALNNFANTSSTPRFDAPTIRHRARRKQLTAGAGLTALALGGIIATLGLIGSPAPASHQAASATNTPAVNAAAVRNTPVHLTPVSYTLEQQDNGAVKLTLDKAPAQPDVSGLQADLDRLNIRAKVYAADPDCYPAPQNPPQAGSAQLPDADMVQIGKENGKQVFTLQPDKIPLGITLEITANRISYSPGSWDILASTGVLLPCMR